MIRTSATLAAIAAVAPVAPLAVAQTVEIDFDTLADGEVITDQIEDRFGLSISGSTASGSSVLSVLGFDLEARSSSFDAELLSINTEGGNLAGVPLGTAIGIGTSSGVDADGDGFVDGATNIGVRGIISFQFDRQLSSFGLDIIDLDGPDNVEFRFFAGGELLATVGGESLIDPGSVFFDPGAEFGNRTANVLVPFLATDLGIEGFDRVDFGIVGAETTAIAGIRVGQAGAAAVPAPSALAAGAGARLIAGRRRRGGS